MSNLTLRKSDIASFNSFIKPFPAEKIMKMIQQYLENKDLEPYSYISLDNFFDVIVELSKFSREKMKFGDKRYAIGGFYDYEMDTLKMSVEIQRLNSEITIYLGETEISAMARDNEYTVKELLGEVYEFFKGIKKSANEWNQLSIQTKPYIKKPPVEKFKKECLTDFLEFSKEEYHYSDYAAREGDGYNEFMKNYMFMAFMTMHFSIPNNYWSFGDKYGLLVEQDHIDNELLVLSVYIVFDGVPAGIKLFEEFYDIYTEYLSAQDIKAIIERYAERIERKAAEWNKSL